MKSLALFACILALSYSTAFGITADEIIEKSINARGGLSKIKALDSYQADGTISTIQGMEMTFSQVLKRPRKFRMDMSVMGMSIITAFDGTTAWNVNPMTGSKAEKSTGQEQQRLEDQADIEGALVDWKEKGLKIELAGSEDVEGMPAYKLKVTKKTGEVKHIYIDATTWLEVKMSSHTSVMGQEADIDMIFSDYRDVAGVQIPMLIEMRSEGSTIMTMTFSSIKANIDIPDARFAFPEATK